MSHAARRSSVPTVLLVVVPLALLAAAGWYVKQAYSHEQRLLDSELLGLATFDADTVCEDAARQAATQLKVELPPAAPRATQEQLRRSIGRKIQEAVQARFQVKKLAAVLGAVSKKFSSAKPGDKVTFQTKLGLVPVTGIYKSRTTENHSIFVTVDQKKYRLFDLVAEYHYLFDEDLASQRATQEIAKLKGEFDSRRNQFVKELQKQLTDKYFRAAGYLPEGEQWRPAKELHAELTETLYQDWERRFTTERDAQIRQILIDHQLFGFYQVEQTVAVTPTAAAAK